MPYAILFIWHETKSVRFIVNQTTIGVVLDSDFEYGVAVYEGIRAGVDKLPGWSIVPVTHFQNSLLLRLAEAGRLDGIIAPVISDRWVEGLRELVPVIVNISNISRIESVSSVVADDYAVGQMAARHLIDMGVSRCGVIGERSVYASLQRVQGFRDTFKEEGLSVEQPIFEGSYSYAGVWENWLMSLNGNLSLFGTSDSLVRRFMQMYQAGQDVMDMSIDVIVGVGDSLIERTLSGIEISSVVLPAGRVGVESVELMKNLLAGEEKPTRLQIKPADIKVRLSSLRADKSHEVIIKARDYIERSLSDCFSVDDVAKYAGASRRKLEMRFKDELGTSPAAYIRNKRMKLAERLLLETGMNVSEVARRCGAGSVQAFTAQFKSCHGLPPGQFRRQG